MFTLKLIVSIFLAIHIGGILIFICMDRDKTPWLKFFTIILALAEAAAIYLIYQ